MSHILLSQSELLTTVQTIVGSNGQISIGKANAGKEIICYVIEANTDRNDKINLSRAAFRQ